MDTLMESSVLGTLFLRFCLCVAEREWEYSKVFTVSNTHHTFWDKMCFVMILGTFRTSVGEPFGLFGVLLGSLFEVLFFTTFEGNRVSAANSGRKWVWGCGVPKTTTSMTSLRARTDPEQAPQDPGTTGTDRQEPQTGVNDHKDTE